MKLVIEIWMLVRPYFVIMVKDWLISVILWILLWAFKWLTKVIQIDGWAGEWINDIHSFSAIIAFAAFGILFVIDVMKMHRKKE